MARWVITTLLLNIPTCMLLLYGGVALTGRSAPMRRLLLSGALAGILLTIFRALPWPFGLHSLSITLTQIVLIRTLSRQSWGLSLLAALATNITVALGEGLVTVPTMGLLGISLKAVLDDPWLTLLGGWLANALLVVLCAFLFYRSRGGQRSAST